MVCRDKQRFFRLLEELKLIKVKRDHLGKLESCEGFVEYKRGYIDEKFEEGKLVKQNVGSTWKLNFLRYALILLENAKRKRKRGQKAHEARVECAARIKDRIPRFDLPDPGQSAAINETGKRPSNIPLPVLESQYVGTGKAWLQRLASRG
jgi:hypothetical protein